MREGFDKEIDSLLRRRARAAAVARPRGNGANAPQADAHLDADELSAFAEGSLPAPARVNAASHLADCDECRSTVVSLARAAGVEGELEKRAAVPASAASAKRAPRREWLASLFAPRVLRYAAPALALLLVAAVTFVALRSRRGEERLAQRAANAAAPRADITNDQKEAETNGALQSSSDATANANANMANANVAARADETSVASNHNAASFGDAASDQSKESPAGGGSSAAAQSKAGETAEDKLDKAAEPPTPAKDQPAAAPAEKAPSSETVDVAKTEERSKAGPPSETENNQVAAEQSPKQQQRSANLARGVEVQSPDGSRNQTRAGVNNTSNNAAGAGGLVARNTREDR